LHLQQKFLFALSDAVFHEADDNRQVHQRIYHAAIQTDDRRHICMQSRKTPCSEEQVRFYAAAVVSGLQYLQERNLVWR